MEQAEPSHAPSAPHSKRLKELENAALQTTLISRMDPGPEQSPRAERRDTEAAAPDPEPEPERDAAEEPGGCVPPAPPRGEEERTLTDHLNKRLLSSFLEKLNERDLALPGVRHLDCAVADEDSNRAADEW